MPVLAALKPFFDAMMSPRTDTEPVSVAQARAAMHGMIDRSFTALTAPCAPVASEEDHRVEVAGGEIVVRLYKAATAPEPQPCYMYLHGGGFWLGTLAQSESLCRGIATQAGCVVASVEYRLAPEHKFPAAAEDGAAALLWLVAHAAALGIDAGRIAVGGGSAGGNLAAVVALMMRDRGGPMPVLQVLEIPVTDFTRLAPLVIADEGLVVPSGKEHYRDYYLRDAGDARDPYASPLLADDLSRLPPALVMCAHYDPLQPEGEAYAERLRAAGVAVEYRCWPGQFHGSQNLAALIPAEAAEYRGVVVAALRRAFGTRIG